MTKKEILKQVFDELRFARESEVFVAEQNEQKALKNAEYFDLDTQKRKLQLQIGKLKFGGIDSKKEQIELANTIKKQQKVLAKIGLKPTDIEPNFKCKKCCDTGIFEDTICTCANQMFFEKLMQQCNVDLDSIPSLSDYDCNFFETENEQIFAKKCKQKFLEFVQNIDNGNQKSIVMCGASGTGKTYFAECIAKELLLKKKSTYFVSSFELGNIFLADHLNKTEAMNLNDLIALDVLVIDDLGTEPIRKNVTKEYLLILLSERLAKNKSTIITTNLSPEQILAMYGERIFSRIFNKRSTLILQFQGKNNRLKK